MHPVQVFFNLIILVRKRMNSLGHEPDLDFWGCRQRQCPIKSFDLGKWLNPLSDNEFQTFFQISRRHQFYKNVKNKKLLNFCFLFLRVQRISQSGLWYFPSFEHRKYYFYFSWRKSILAYSKNDKCHLIKIKHNLVNFV